ncbi:hypothetical protein SRB5_70070 [Streptomyces sp. RB5]|uniref:Uncharacterized protein n=1 Tax=Streptomyces smaragdinus TaxID=2585196 RepID=A0A7K0CVW5_9ACTN|nr:S8 family serine peptidase [Streptomyces smaragdinus]MQY16804.1 hypothetical protein [Streptomyces smaragdinus]
MRPNARRGTGRRWGTVTVGLTVFGMLVPAAAQAADPAGQTPPSRTTTKSAAPKKTATTELARLVDAAGGNVPITLVTGDTVRIGVDDRGTAVVRDAEMATRPDGVPVVLQTFTRQGKTFVVPNDALTLLDQGVLDWSLFDVDQLVTLAAAKKSDTVPVLVSYTDAAAAKEKRKVTGAADGRALPSIKGRSLKIADDGRWWRGVKGKTARTAATTRASGSLSDVRKVWLNGISHVDLEQSVPQVGAPVAWERGLDGTGVKVAVLDTGIDATHPDVADSIVEQVDFTGNAKGARDGHGHGTHVASTVLGSGAASKGLRKGVAPGAELMVGKVCNDAGECPDDAIIAAMEWAAHSGAKIVNLSLGGDPSDGTDPLSQALNTISRDTGALFVVAAGNTALGLPQKVVSPAAADEAMAVAAVDKMGEMARFSNVGPRLGDGAAKPDIAAPGVGIVAARAAGTSMGSAVDANYTASDGTSMATPHVTGAAAVIAQQHPEMTGQQIKALLMDTATDLGHSMYSQGTGQVDLAAATNPRVLPKGNLNFGTVAHGQPATTKKITYTNRGDEAVTLHLSLSASFGDGKPAEAGLFTLGTDTVVVPANGTAEVPVTVDGSVLDNEEPHGGYAGRLSARDDSGDIQLNSMTHAFLEAVRYPLTLNIVPPAGATDVHYGAVAFVPMDDQIYLHPGYDSATGAQSVTKELYRGTYAAQASVTWRDASGELQQAEPMATEVKLTEAKTVTLDLREARPLRARFPEATESYSAIDYIDRVSATGAWGLSSALAHDYARTDQHWWELPTEKVTEGTLAHEFRTSETTPVVTMRATGGGAPADLSVRYQSPDSALAATQAWLLDDGDPSTRQASLRIPRLPVKGQLPVVYAGNGSAAELADANARGKLVLITPTDICRGSCDYPRLRDERVAAAAATGAVGVLVAAPDLTSMGVPSGLDQCVAGPESCPEVEPYLALPTVSLPYDQADALIKRIEAGGSQVRITLGGSATPRTYAAGFYESGRIGSYSYELGKDELDRVDLSFHAQRPGDVYQLGWTQFRKDVADPTIVPLPTPATQQKTTVFVQHKSDSISRFNAGWAETGADLFITRNRTQTTDLIPTGRDEIHWNAGPAVPGADKQVRTGSGYSIPQTVPCAGCRQGNTFYPTVYLMGSDGGPQAVIGTVGDEQLVNLLAAVPSCGPTPNPTIPNLAYTCDFKLLDASGDELEHQTEHLPDTDGLVL